MPENLINLINRNMEEEETFSLFNPKLNDDEPKNDENNTINYDLFSPSNLVYDLSIEKQNIKRKIKLRKLAKEPSEEDQFRLYNNMFNENELNVEKNNLTGEEDLFGPSNLIDFEEGSADIIWQKKNRKNTNQLIGIFTNDQKNDNEVFEKKIEENETIKNEENINDINKEKELEIKDVIVIEEKNEGENNKITEKEIETENEKNEILIKEKNNEKQKEENGKKEQINKGIEEQEKEEINNKLEAKEEKINNKEIENELILELEKGKGEIKETKTGNMNENDKVSEKEIITEKDNEKEIENKIEENIKEVLINEMEKKNK